MAQQSLKVSSSSWAPLALMQPAFEEDRAPHSKASVNVLSLGFAATAILLSLFLLIALFERFLRPAPPAPSPLPPPLPLSLSLPLPSSKHHHLLVAPPCDHFVGVSVVMPGHTIPTFIAQPAALPHSGLNEAAPRPPSKTLIANGS